MQDQFSWVHLAHGPVAVPLEEKQYINGKDKGEILTTGITWGDAGTFGDRDS